MKNLYVGKAGDYTDSFKDGVSEVELLPGMYEDARVTRCVVRAGESWQPELFAFGDRIQFFFFVKGSGYIAMKGRAHNVTQMAVFVPRFDEFAFTIHAGTDMEFLRFVGRMKEYDLARMKTISISMPRFRNLEDCWTYDENIKQSDTKSYMIIEHRFLGRYSLGAVIGKGPCTVGEHAHPDLLQWCYVLPGARYRYRAGDQVVDVSEGDITFIPLNVPHSVDVQAGDVMDYIWFEIAADGYK